MAIIDAASKEEDNIKQSHISRALEETKEIPRDSGKSTLFARKSKKNSLMENKTIPYLTNLHEDPQLSGKVYYSLTRCPFYIGRKTGNPMPKIILGALGI